MFCNWPALRSCRHSISRSSKAVTLPTHRKGASSIFGYENKRIRWTVLILVLLFVQLFFSLGTGALGEAPTPAPDTIIEPTLSNDAAPYDSSHPESLAQDQLYAMSALLVEADTGLSIFEKNADTVMYPASTTKILTVLLGIMMVDDLNQMVTVSRTAVDIPADSSTMGLEEGEEIRYIDVLYGTMMRSANEGANVIAETVSGSIPAFIDLMNKTATEVFGCSNTHFVNAHGYHDDNHYTTARDLAIIAREAMKNETFRQIVAATSYEIPRTNVHRAKSITTRSILLLPGSEEKPNKYYYSYANGIKTGSHMKAGYCFVGSAMKDNVNLISVLLYTSNRGRWTDTIKLMNYGFSQYISVTPAEMYAMNPIVVETSNYSLKDGHMGKLELTCIPSSGNVSITATKDEVEQMAKNIRSTAWIQFTRDFQAPITQGEVMGTMTYFYGGGKQAEYQLVASRSIGKRENAPKTLAEIVAETEADPNILPPITAELVMYALSPFFVVFILVRLLMKMRRTRQEKVSKPPKQTRRWFF